MMTPSHHAYVPFVSVDKMMKLVLTLGGMSAWQEQPALQRALADTGARALNLGGGVACNRGLRAALARIKPGRPAGSSCDRARLRGWRSNDGNARLGR